MNLEVGDGRRSGGVLRSGDWVEVRSLPEILATLDRDGRCGEMPFMPEMVRYCGRRFRVAKRAEKTCFGNSFRRLGGAVHLADVRCDGTAHDGCQLRCLTFWREEWLRRAPGPEPSADPASTGGAGPNGSHGGESRSATVAVARGLPTREESGDGGLRYVCQATALGGATREKLNPWDPRPLFREVQAGNASWSEVTQFSRWTRAWARLRIFKAFSHRATTPPGDPAGISVGDWVEVRSPNEILSTLTKDGRHRGLRLSEDMLTFCGERFRVSGEVTRFIDETTGRMRVMRNRCLTLEGAACRGFNVMCPRAHLHFWRPEWLRRLDQGTSPPAPTVRPGRE